MIKKETDSKLNSMHGKPKQNENTPISMDGRDTNMQSHQISYSDSRRNKLSANCHNSKRLVNNTQMITIKRHDQNINVSENRTPDIFNYTSDISFNISRDDSQ